MTNQMITIGSVLKPQGIKGELKVLPMTDDESRFESLKEVFVKDTSFRVLSVRVHDGFAYLCLEGITDRDAAENFRNAQLCVRRDQAIPLREGRYFIDDVLGSTVSVGEQTIGIVTAIDNFGAADVYTVKGERVVRFPLIKRLVVKISPDNKEISLDSQVFTEVAVYED